MGQYDVTRKNSSIMFHESRIQLTTQVIGEGGRTGRPNQIRYLYRRALRMKIVLLEDHTVDIKIRKKFSDALALLKYPTSRIDSTLQERLTKRSQRHYPISLQNLSRSLRPPKGYPTRKEDDSTQCQNSNSLFNPTRKPITTDSHY